MNLRRTWLLTCAAVLTTSAALAQTPPPVPERQIPPGVLAELRILNNRFESALAQDCAPERCFANGCTYGEHRVADRPQAGALPGLAEDKGPGSGAPQEYLTLARCAFSHERSLSPRDAQALVRRLQTKLTSGWTVVEVSSTRLPPIAASLREPPEPPKVETPPPPPEPVVAPEPPPPAWELPVAMRELWLSLLPHFSWMIAVIMVTFAALLLIWGWRRLGRLSPEEELLMNQMSSTPAEADEGPVETPVAPESEPKPDTFVTDQREYWATRLRADEAPDEDVRALIAEWLKADQLGLLAKAVLLYPEALPAAFPDGGEFAEAKLRFSQYLKDVSEAELPSDEVFYGQLRQHALSASLGRHPDTRGMANLRGEFGAGGLVQVMATLPPRFSALLFAHATVDDQLEAARLLSSAQVADVAEQLLQSNRMSRSEADYLVQLLAASNSDEPLPAPPQRPEISDLGTIFDAPSALSILLPNIEAAERSALLANAKARFGGVFAGWYKGIVFPEMVMQLPDEVRADLLLEPTVRNLAAWLSILPEGQRAALLEGMPTALRTALGASAEFATRGEQLRRYREGRLEVAAALHRQLGRISMPFESVMR